MGSNPYDPNSVPVTEKIVVRPGGETETIYVPIEKDVIITVPIETGDTYISGYPDGSFGPDRFITRAEVAAVMTRIDGGSAGSSTVFPDVSADAWYATSIAYVNNKGIMGGYPDGTFKPNAPITRAEVASLLQRYSNLSGGSANPFTDILGHWAEQVILDVAQAGYVSGYPDSTFRPDHPITRAEFVSMTNRMLNREPDIKAINAQGHNPFNDVAPTHWAYYEILEASMALRLGSSLES